MPDHANWLTLVLAHMKDALGRNAHHLGETFIGHEAPTWQSWEPLAAAILTVSFVLLFSVSVRGKISGEGGLIPEDKLTMRTFAEIFLEYFYDTAKSVMDPVRAKKYFPIIATSALFVFFSNVMALLPGMPVATSSLNITLACALVVFIIFNLYGIKEHGLDYFKHMAGPLWFLAPLIFPVELISLCVRPITLAVRLMVNMAVDHLILSIFLAMVAVLIPLPVMLLGCIVIVVQTLVFAYLTCIYIDLATAHEAH
jgi:F-type H+-transporting ATPase subunit a